MLWENGYILGDNFLFTTLCFSLVSQNVPKIHGHFSHFLDKLAKPPFHARATIAVSLSPAQVTKSLDPSVCVQTALSVLANLARRYLSAVFDIASA